MRRAHRALASVFAAMAAAGGTDELTEARGKLRVVEEELRVAKGELAAEKARGDVLLIAKAELGVAEAKWTGASAEDQRERLGRLVDTSQKSVESAQKVVDAATRAYEKALDAAAPPHGVRRVLPPAPSGLADPGSNEDEVKKLVKASELAPLLARKREGNSVNKHRELSEILGRNCISVWGEACAISHLQPTRGTVLSRAHIIPQAALKKDVCFAAVHTRAISSRSLTRVCRMSTILSLKIFEKRFTEAFSAPSMSSQCTQPLKGGLTRASSVWM